MRSVSKLYRTSWVEPQLHCFQSLSRLVIAQFWISFLLSNMAPAAPLAIATYVTVPILLALSTVFIVLRFIAVQRLKRSYRSHDWLALAALGRPHAGRSPVPNKSRSRATASVSTRSSVSMILGSW